jgi:hypothetical protein
VWTVTARRLLANLATVGLISIAGVAATATAAHATPTGCSAYALAGVGYGSCSGGTGSLRVVIACVSVNGDDIVRFGNLVPVGQVSTAHCPSSSWSLQPDPWVETFG